MINWLIRSSLGNRPIVLGLALLVLVYGGFVLQRLPLDVLPDLNRPTVTLLTEAPGYAPEEVETLVTIPIENAVAGANGLLRLRSTSDVGLSIVFAEFDWGTDIYTARQVVQERLQILRGGALPEGVTPVMGPISSLLGEIMLVGLTTDNEEISPMELRTIADWTVGRRLQGEPGVSQVLAIGGGVQQVHILPDPEMLAAYGVRYHELEEAAAEAAANTNSGYMVGPARELIVRNVAMAHDPQAFALTVVKETDGGRNVTIGDVADVRNGPQIMRGDAGVNGGPGVILSVQKAQGADTLELTEHLETAIADLETALPQGVELEVLFRQADFIENALHNLAEALRDGAVMVAIVLLLFLLNLRTTFITLAAIPLSFAITAIVFAWLEVGINSMTLGGIAVAIGMVVDDAIVDVENVFRRLRENRALENPRPVSKVVADASIEIRGAILYATLLIVLVFLPLFGLGGVEGRLFRPIAIATIVSMLASFLVAVTVIPVLASLLLPRMRRMKHKKDSFVVRLLKGFSRNALLRPALAFPMVVLGVTSIIVAFCFALWPVMGKSFLPPFNEGSAMVSMIAAPGTSLEKSVALGQVGEALLREIPEIKSVGRRTGRAEQDDHVMPVNVNEYDIEFTEEGRPREVVLAEIREKLTGIPGVFLNVGQPISHRIDHMMSGVEAQLAVKVFGDDLRTLRAEATEIAAMMREIDGLIDINVERQQFIPQVQVVPDREAAAALGIRPGALVRTLSHIVGGIVVGEVRDRDRPLDVFVRLDEEARDTPEELGQLLVETGSGSFVPLHQVADVRQMEGPNLVNREDGRRRIIISANAEGGRDLVSLVDQLREQTAGMELPEGYYLSFDGQYKAQQESTVRIAWLAALALVGMVFLLYGHFRSGVLVAQTLVNIPLACAGALVLTYLTIGEISLATLVGLIALAGIATRNTIMMISHYLHLMRYEGGKFDKETIIRGSLERLVPVAMTALTAGIALLPLALSAGEPGKEILHPVAIAIIGGLVSSTLLDSIVTPAAFYHFGRKAARLHLERTGGLPEGT